MFNVLKLSMSSCFETPSARAASATFFVKCGRTSFNVIFVNAQEIFAPGYFSFLYATWSRRYTSGASGKAAVFGSA
jgi:hypothetical protein